MGINSLTKWAGLRPGRTHLRVGRAWGAFLGRDAGDAGGGWLRDAFLSQEHPVPCLTPAFWAGASRDWTCSTPRGSAGLEVREVRGKFEPISAPCCDGEAPVGMCGLTEVTVDRFCPF